MANLPLRLLITGRPGVGKTTFIRQLVEELRDWQPVGFYTQEIRCEGGSRLGFELVSLSGQRGILSHVQIETGPRVGRYTVNVADFEAFLEGIPFHHPKTRLVIIDEIGKMECLSPSFRDLLENILTSKKHLLAAVSLKGGGLIDRIKSRLDVELLHLNEGNRQALRQTVLERFALQR